MIPIYTLETLTPEQILTRKIQAEENVSAAVDAVLAEVRAKGDAALLAYTEAFDGVALTQLQVTPEEMEAAWASLEPDLPRAPVYLLKHRPRPRNAAFFFSNTPAKPGSKPALTSLESIRLFISVRRTPSSQYGFIAA